MFNATISIMNSNFYRYENHTKESATMNQLRRDPITGIWTIVVNNGWDPDKIKLRNNKEIRHFKLDEMCIFCTGHEKETPPELFAIRPDKSSKNKPGWRVRVVPEKRPVLQIHGDLNNRGLGIYDMYDGIGAHEIVVETPDHNKNLTDLSDEHFTEVLTAYKERILDLKQDERFRYVLVHKGMGNGLEPNLRHACSNILATPITPGRVRDELLNAQQFFALKERCIFCDVIRQETEDDQRILEENDSFIALCPFAAGAPFEVWILPKKHETFYEWNTELLLLSQLFRSILLRFRDILNDPDYSMEIHSGPNLVAGKRRGYWKTVERDFHWHIELVPKLHGYTNLETGLGFQVNWVSPEKSADFLNNRS